MEFEKRNVIDLRKEHLIFKNNGLRFSVSSRKVKKDDDIIRYLKLFYMYVDLKQIESVFGNSVFFSKLYGGRQFIREHSLTEEHIKELQGKGIGISLTLTNHFFSDSAYNESLEILNRYHQKGNSIICVNDQLAKKIKKEFPKYTLKASIIKNINTHEKIKKELDLYDFITLSMEKNDDDEFLLKINEKKKVILFGNADCAYNCPSRDCYLGISEKIFGKKVTSTCSKKRIPRLDFGQVFFDVEKLNQMGFMFFKLVPMKLY